jgi:hypothetical protein
MFAEAVVRVSDDPVVELFVAQSAGPRDELRGWRDVTGSSGPVGVTAVAYVDDRHDMSLVVDSVNDAVGSAASAEPVI